MSNSYSVYRKCLAVAWRRLNSVGVYHCSITFLIDFIVLVDETEYQWCCHDSMILFQMDMCTSLEHMVRMVHSSIFVIAALAAMSNLSLPFISIWESIHLKLDVFLQFDKCGFLSDLIIKTEVFKCCKDAMVITDSQKIGCLKWIC